MWRAGRTPHAALPLHGAALPALHKRLGGPTPACVCVPRVLQGLTQVVAGVALLVAFAGPALGGRFSQLIGVAVVASGAELVLVSLLIRQRHRMARSALGRLYGFSYDVFSSIHGVIAMALQRTFAGAWGACV